jgi:DNA-binding XRE family transcriptional regulator
MKMQKHAGHSVAELRKIIGKSQSQFATMIGVSKHSIISVENGRTKELSKNLTKLIQIATGAELANGRFESPFKVADYTRDDFDRWRQKYGRTDKATALKQFNEMKTWVKILFLAAAKSGRAGNRDRLPAVCLSLGEWLDEARVNFKLQDEIEDLLDDETRTVRTGAHVILALLEDPKRSQKDLAEHDIDFSKIKRELKRQATDGYLFIQDEYRSTWGPGRDTYKEVNKPRILLPHARYWIKKFKGSLADLQNYGHSPHEFFEYVKHINQDPSFAESEARLNSPKS